MSTNYSFIRKSLNHSINESLKEMFDVEGKFKILNVNQPFLCFSHDKKHLVMVLDDIEQNQIEIKVKFSDIVDDVISDNDDGLALAWAEILMKASNSIKKLIADHPIK